MLSIRCDFQLTRVGSSGHRWVTGSSVCRQAFGRQRGECKDFGGLCCCHLYPQFSSLQKEIEERANDIEVLKGEQVKLQGVIKSLEKDILGLKREIQERDETIQDKVKAPLCPPLTTTRIDPGDEDRAQERGPLDALNTFVEPDGG